ncbi:hypothetical protein IFR04_014526 [Cadophora malorum]|uniref:Uncharacterized protein n=1 Tax=Cadophora malorum TaxID=108018 RepID=A0A8H7W250_9HELO|nr:hypothetical protein IFR04_014526 [Cadophora malorum]
MTFAVSWARDSSTCDLPKKSDFSNGDVKELMEAMKNRGWKDVLDVKVVFDPAVKNGLKTMTEGECAWAPIAARADEEHRLAKIKFAKRLAEEESD